MKDKVANQLLNEERHLNNKAALAELGLPPEKIMKVVTRVVKQGKKVIKTSTIVEKNKRASKLLRKERRRQARLALGTQIEALDQKLGQEDLSTQPSAE